LLGAARLRAGKGDEAIISYTAALAVDSSNTAALRGRGTAHGQLQNGLLVAAI
jgi:cytochrome c-type biogenesis protein CcmH/NrfG